MRRRFLIPCLGLLLAGCGFTETGGRLRDFVAVEGARAYDEGLANAEFFVCRAASIGSVQRRYGGNRETAQAWRTLCLGDGEAVVDLITLPTEAGRPAAPAP